MVQELIGAPQTPDQKPLSPFDQSIHDFRSLVYAHSYDRQLVLDGIMNTQRIGFEQGMDKPTVLRALSELAAEGAIAAAFHGDQETAINLDQARERIGKELEALEAGEQIQGKRGRRMRRESTTTQPSGTMMKRGKV